MRTAFVERFNDQFIPEPMSGCWLWTGQVARESKPYGRISWDGKTWAAHRASYVLHVGPIPDGLWVLHKCDNPSCVNPQHLFLGTSNDNVSDRDNKGRNAKADSHGFWRKRGARHIQSNPVRATFPDGTTRDFESYGMAKEAGFCPGPISMCVFGRRPTHKGATWTLIVPASGPTSAKAAKLTKSQSDLLSRLKACPEAITLRGDDVRIAQNLERKGLAQRLSSYLWQAAPPAKEPQ